MSDRRRGTVTGPAPVRPVNGRPARPCDKCGRQYVLRAVRSFGGKLIGHQCAYCMETYGPKFEREEQS